MTEASFFAWPIAANRNFISVGMVSESSYSINQISTFDYVSSGFSYINTTSILMGLRMVAVMK